MPVEAPVNTPTAHTESSARERSALASQIRALPTEEAAAFLERAQPAQAVEALLELNPAIVQSILREIEPGSRRLIAASAPAEVAEQWKRNTNYADGTIGRLMEPAMSIVRPEMTVGEAVEALRPVVRTSFVTYAWVLDEAARLVGLVTMRDLLFSERSARLSEVMLKDPFRLSPAMAVPEAMKLTVNRHYPVYPVCDEQGKLLGLVRGQAIFETQAFEITAQAGSMVGVDKEERISTPMVRSFMFRHPWLQLNLLTAFLAGGVVALFQGTIDQLVILAVFLPVLAGQSGNTGCQALAVTLRGITLGEITNGDSRKLVIKEGLLGAMNGAPVGMVSGIAMFVIASAQHSPHALVLALVVFLAMVGACTISGISGALVPLTLKRFGTDPATASSIFLTTATDIVSMGMLLGLATLLVH